MAIQVEATGAEEGRPQRQIVGQVDDRAAQVTPVQHVALMAHCVGYGARGVGPGQADVGGAVDPSALPFSAGAK